MTQLEEKKMLAEFMGAKKGDNGIYYFDTVPINISNIYNDYNSLMQVVEKIESIENEMYQFIIDRRCVNIDYVYGSKGFYTRQHKNTKLESIYRACVEFVKWWNEQQDKTK